MMSRRAPIVVWCNHGIQGERGDVVQRFRWHATKANGYRLTTPPRRIPLSRKT